MAVTNANAYTLDVQPQPHAKIPRERLDTERHRHETHEMPKAGDYSSNQKQYNGISASQLGGGPGQVGVQRVNWPMIISSRVPIRAGP